MGDPPNFPMALLAPAIDPNDATDTRAKEKDKFFEEGMEVYRKDGFHPMRLGEIFNGRYKVLRKLGWGACSTVWLVKDLKDQKYWAMKVLSADAYDGSEDDLFEIEILQLLRKANPSHPGFGYISHLQDHFTHEGPNGKHMCLLFKLMGESLHTFNCFPQGKIQDLVIRRFTVQLLKALAYAHECGIIHTDISRDNIMVQIPDTAIIERYLDTTSPPPPTPTATLTSPSDYEIIPTQSLQDVYLEIQNKSEDPNLMTLDIALSDWGQACFTDRRLDEMIQRDHLRAPEVILCAPWGTAADIWSLGALLPELIYDQETFSVAEEYSPELHLKEMNKLLGPFPWHLLMKGRARLITQIFGGLGNVREEKTKIKEIAGFEERFANMEDGKRERFIGLLKMMMALDPEKRVTAEEGLEYVMDAFDMPADQGVEK